MQERGMATPGEVSSPNSRPESLQKFCIDMKRGATAVAPNLTETFTVLPGRENIENSTVLKAQDSESNQLQEESVG